MSCLSVEHEFSHNFIFYLSILYVIIWYDWAFWNAVYHCKATEKTWIFLYLKSSAESTKTSAGFFKVETFYLWPIPVCLCLQVKSGFEGALRGLDLFEPWLYCWFVGGVGCQMAVPWISARYRALPLSMLINPNQRAASVTPRSTRDAPTGLILL